MMHRYNLLAALLCSILLTTGIQAQIVVDLDPSTPPPAIETTLSVPLGTTVPVNVYLAVPSGFPFPMFDAYGVALEFNDGASIVTLGALTLFDPTSLGLFILATGPTDLMPPPGGGAPVGPATALTRAGFAPGAMGPGGPFTGSDGGVGVFSAGAPFAPGGPFTLLHSTTFMGTGAGTTDIAPIGVFPVGMVPGPPPPPAAVLPAGPAGTWPAVCELYDSATGTTICPGIVPSTLTVTPPLPVELVSFEAVVDEDGVRFTWETATETNNAGFELQHSRVGDGLTEDRLWPSVGYVEGHGTTTQPHRYSHKVSGLAPGQHRFRLKQVDFDGTAHFSETVEVLIELPGTHRLSAAYPNPFNPQTAFTLTVAQEQAVQIDVFDATGRRVRTLFEGTLSANVAHLFTFDAQGLPSGLYLIHAQGQAFREARSVMLAN